MSIISKYIAYLKDNPQRYWFKRKLYGWGWTPATWEGWAVLVVFVAIAVCFAVNFTSIPSPTDSDAFWFVGEIFVWAAILIFICYKKGESPRWMWGLPKDNDRR